MSSSIKSHGGRIHRRAGLTMALALAALAALPAIASASAVATDATSVTFTGDGNADTVTVTHSGGTYTFVDTGGITATAGGGCTQVDPNTATCPGTNKLVNATMGNGVDSFTAATVSQTAAFTISGGNDGDNLTGSDANDTLNGDDGQDTLNGDDGNDNLFGGLAEDTVNGGTGNDNLSGGTSNDNLNGGDGHDRMDGGADQDTFDGGAGANGGVDRVLYGGLLHAGGPAVSCSEGAGASITITIDGTNNDQGCNGEGNDNVLVTVEAVTGSVGADSITGSCQNNTLAGDPTPGAGSGPNDDDTLTGDPAGCLAATTDGSESDFFGGGDGTDIFNGDGTGNPGLDAAGMGIPYTPTALNITLDSNTVAAGNDTDGLGQTNDNVHADIDLVAGGTGADIINADFALVNHRVFLFGRLGNDALTGSDFEAVGDDDFLDGQGGAETTLDCQGGSQDEAVQGAGDVAPVNCETVTPG